MHGTINNGNTDRNILCNWIHQKTLCMHFSIDVLFVNTQGWRNKCISCWHNTYRVNNMDCMHVQQQTHTISYAVVKLVTANDFSVCNHPRERLQWSEETMFCVVYWSQYITSSRLKHEKLRRRFKTWWTRSNSVW